MSQSSDKAQVPLNLKGEVWSEICFLWDNVLYSFGFFLCILRVLESKERFQISLQ